MVQIVWATQMHPCREKNTNQATNRLRFFGGVGLFFTGRDDGVKNIEMFVFLLYFSIEMSSFLRYNAFEKSLLNVIIHFGKS